MGGLAFVGFILFFKGDYGSYAGTVEEGKVQEAGERTNSPMSEVLEEARAR